jgi:integrase
MIIENDLGTFEITKVKVNDRGGKLQLHGYINGKLFRKATKKKSTKANIKFLEKHGEKLLLDLSGLLDVVKEPEKTFMDYTKILIDLKKGDITDNTLKQYSNRIERYIKPFFKNMDIKHITPLDVKRWYSWLYQEHKLSKIQPIKSVLQSVFAVAVDDRTIDRNPALGVSIPKTTNVNNNSQYISEAFSDTDVKKIMGGLDDFIEAATITSVKQHRETFKNMVYVLLGSGMRIGEMLALTWDDIDFENETININKTNRSGVIKSPKTKAGIRMIDMSNEAKIALKNQLKIKTSNIVFSKTNGDIFKSTGTITSNLWGVYLSFIGVEHRRMYNLRHTFATNCLVNDLLDIVSLSKMLGHANVAVTLERYVKSSNVTGKIQSVSLYAA